MDDIARHLRDEITSLEEHIERTENRLLAAHWAEELLDPFERLEPNLDESDLRTVVQAFHHARLRFRVNGHLADRIDDILARHRELIPAAVDGEADSDAYEDVLLSPDTDPGDTTSADDAGSLFYVDDEEVPGAADDDMLADDERAPESADDDLLVNDDLSADALFTVDDGTTADDGQEDGPDGASRETPAAAAGGDDLDGEPAALPQDEGASSDPSDADADDLFAEDETPPSAEENVEGAAAEASAPSRLQRRAPKAPAGPPPERTSREKESRVRGARSPEVEAEAESFDILAHRIELDDVAAALDIRVSAEERAFYDARRATRMNDRVSAALRQNSAAAGQYILIPRLGQLSLQGAASMPVTVKNLAKRYIGLFGDIRDLMRYRNESFMSSETPERGWALVTAECPRESMGKNYMEQNQYLRYLATSLSIPSHLVRRRTMVEAIYDLIVGELVLGKHLQRASLDWTTSSPAKNDFVCVYYPDEGIRVRDLSRVTHHRSLGVTPTW